MNKPLQITLFLFLYLPSFVFSQNPSTIFFIDQTNLLENTDVHSGVAMGIADMNADQKDDIIRFDQGRIMSIEYQGNPDAAFATHTHGAVHGSSEWSMCVADADENGYNDVLVGGFGHVNLLMANNSGTSYTMSALNNANIFLQGSNFVDINNDGALDIFACHDNGLSRAYENNGSGGFSFNNGLITATSSPASDDSGNYASIWTDYDNDGDLDMYLSKCRQGASSFTDLRRINMLWENDGNNNFTEVAEQAGLKIGAQTWATDFADIDNDGDMDCFVLNHDSPSQLLENMGDGTFVDITSNSGMSAHLNFSGIQAIFRDFDNDGLVDLLVSGHQHRLFFNNGNGNFTKAPNPFSDDDVQSFAIGDLNSDGFLDVYTGYANFFTNPSNIPDRLFMNGGNDNHYLTVHLEGTNSNKNAVGAKLELYGTWGMQCREVRSGEGYGIMNSFNQHFGLGTATQIDKLIVRWPAGGVTEILNPTADQLLVVTEGDDTPTELMTQSIDFTPIPDQWTTAMPFEVFAFASSDLEVSLSILEGPATISGHTISLTGEEGLVVVEASQAGNIEYAPAANVQQTFVVMMEEEEELCENVTDAGIIFGDEVGCDTYETTPITNDLLAAGGSGAMNYIWQQSTVSATSGWENRIETGTDLILGFVNQTTWFRRGARRALCEDYLFSNVIVKEVIADCGGPDNGPDDYCETGGQRVDYEWIESISIGTMSHQSGPNNGHGDFRHINIPLNMGQTYTMSLVPGFAGNIYNEVWRVWIDFNYDNNFNNDDELVLENNGLATVTDEIFIPSGILSGETRMRVAMRWNIAPEACGDFAFGEVEDYTIQLVGNLSPNPAEQMANDILHVPDKIVELYPNPTHHNLFVDIKKQDKQLTFLKIQNPQGQIISTLDVGQITGDPLQINVANLPKGLYFMQVHTLEARMEFVPFVIN